MAVEYKLIGGLENLFVDDTGEPVIGGYLYSFKASDHSTKKNIAKRSNPTDPSHFYTNPIELNASGIVPSDYVMYYANDELYYLVLTTADQNPTLPPDSGNIIRTWDNIGPDQESGPQVEETDFTNYAVISDFAQPIKSKFEGSQLPAGSTKVALANWYYKRNNTNATRTIEFKEFSPGQDTVPGNPINYFVQTTTAGGSGESINDFVLRINDVRSFSGETITLVFYAQTASGTPLEVVYTQYFGSTGSPENTKTPGSAISITSTWVKYIETFTIDSVNGKSIDEEDENYIDIGFRITPGNTSQMDIARVQIIKGDVELEYNYLPPDYSNAQSVGLGIPNLPLSIVSSAKKKYLCTDEQGNLTWEQVIPAGSEIWWPTETVPDGWLQENGQTIKHADYLGLGSVIGKQFGFEYGSSSVFTDTVTFTNRQNGSVTDISAGTSGFTVAVTQQGSPTQPEISTIQTVPATSIIPGSYFEFQSIDNGLSVQNLYIYIIINNTGLDPALAGKIGIPLQLTGFETNTEVAAKLQIIMDPLYLKLQDTRGYFIRNWSDGAGADPDRASRVDRGDGTTGDQVGTFQGDALEQHTHLYNETTQDTGDIGGGDELTSQVSTPTLGVIPPAKISTETRSKNIYRMLIIKT